MLNKLRNNNFKILVGMLSFGIMLLPIPNTVFMASAPADTVTVAPNLMIILSTSASMAQEMQGSVYPPAANGLPIQNTCPANYSSSSDYYPSDTFASDDGCGGTGTTWSNNLYGNQPDSKIYIAKEVLYNLLKGSSANNINFGFATYRQAFGLQLSTSVSQSSAVYPYIYLPGASYSNPTPGSYGNDTATKLNAVGSNPLNFSDTDWWPIWDNNTNNDAFFGKNIDQATTSPSILASTVTYMSNNVGNGGLPNDVQYPSGTATPSTVNNIYYGEGGDDVSEGVPITTPEPLMNLCKTFYNAEANEFQAIYNADNSNGTPDMFTQAFPGTYSGNNRNYITFSVAQYNAQGQSTPDIYSHPCYNGTSEQMGSDNQLISDTLNTPNGTEPAYFTYIPMFWSGSADNGASLGVAPGALDGWSGATSTTYNESTGISTSTATYPSKPENEKDLTGSYDESGVKWMGPFVNLPDPATGYTAQASTIAKLLNPDNPQEQASGLDYSYSSQTMTNGDQKTSVAVSSLPGSYDQFQEPVYDSLEDALAYFTAYKKADPYNGCRTNEILLVYDGHEDGHPIFKSNGNVTYLNPATIAKQLAAIGVKTNVVIISSNKGDITEADAIAAAGETGTALQVSNYQSLYSAISSVFSSISGTATSAPPVTPGNISNTSYVYETASNPVYGSVAGHLFAYKTASNGTPALSPSWDAAAKMNTSNRSADLYSDTYAGSPVAPTLFNGLPSSAFNSAAPNPSTIESYTITPDYNSGAYLAGRASTSFVGAINDQAMQPALVTQPNNINLNSAVSVGNGESYTQFAQSEAGLPNSVVFSSNDGFLYDVNANTGALKWGWIPSPFLSKLANYTNFWQSSPMNGGFSYLQAANSTGWGNYIVGTANGGALQYGIQLNAQGMLSEVVWIEQNANATSANAQAPVVFWNTQTGIAYAAYITSSVVNGTTTSTLNITEVDNGSTTSAALPFVASSSITVGNYNLYVGDVNGKVWQIPEGNSASSMVSAISEIGATPAVNSNGTTSTQAINYVGYTQLNGVPHVWATSVSQITNFMFTSTGWAPEWNSFTGGSGSWLNGTYTADSTGTSTSTTGIQWLPVNSSIDANTIFVDGALIVPVYTPASGSSAACGVGSGYYYIYSLTNGYFPNGLFTDSKGNAITGNILVGLGTPYAAQVSTLHDGGLMLYGSSQQNTSGGIGVQASAVAHQNVGDGVTAWRNYTMQ
jgi:hypothetical protein